MRLRQLLHLLQASHADTIVLFGKARRQRRLVRAPLLPELLLRLKLSYLLYRHSNDVLMAFPALNRLLQASAALPRR